MNPYELVITTTKELESILAKHFQADGIGLIQRVNDVEQLLPKSIVGKVRYLGGERNKLAHDVDFELQDPERFFTVYNEVKNTLLEIAGVTEEVPKPDGYDKENYKQYWSDPENSEQTYTAEQLELLKAADFSLVKGIYYFSVFCLLIGPHASIVLLALIPILYFVKKSLQAMLKTHCRYLITNIFISLIIWLGIYIVFDEANTVSVIMALIWLSWYLWRNYRGLALLKQVKAIM